MNRFSLSMLAASLVFGSASRASESWANTNLAVTHDLELWFDASAENAARLALKLPPLNPGREFDLWHDASGKARHASQRVKESRPQLRRSSGSFFVRFDGKNDFLSAGLSSAVLDEATVFIFAAPRSNPGGFRGFLSWNALGKNDYQSGFNLDLGSAASTNWNFANIEGAGVPGERNLLKNPAPFSHFHTLTVALQRDRVRFYIDSAEQPGRSRKPSSLIMDELTLGARFNDGAGGIPAINGYFDGDIAEILVFGRVLADSERKQVEDYFSTKYAALSQNVDDPFAPVEKPFVAVSNPSPVQMLVPGFQVRQLPLQLNNINNLVYAPDGRLFALGYDGNVFQLKDTDGDGLEDRADFFFRNDRNEIPSTIGMAWGPGGLYLPIKGKVIRLRDKGDGTSQLETVTSDWVAPAKFGGSSLDAVAIAVDKEGAVYFGLGCDDWTGAYRVNKQTGKSDYDIRSERGTILRLSPDWKKREIIATGLRWPSSLAFNSQGDLFCTDQEGATWLPNGSDPTTTKS